MIVTQFDYKCQIIPESLLRPHMSPEAQHSFLISSYTHNNHPTLSLRVYASLRRTGVHVDCYTVPSVLKAAGQSLSPSWGEEIHGYAVKTGHVSDLFVLNALMQMYAACGSVALARQMFDRLPHRDSVSWSTMIGCFARNGMTGEALELVRGMFGEGVRPGDMAIVSMANLFAGLGDPELGRAMHGYAVRNVADERFGPQIRTSLMDMYVKCGKLGQAKRLFDGLARRSVVSWTVIIAGFFRYGEVAEGARMFGEMLEDGVFPNEVTVLSVVSECGNAGALGVGKCLHSYVLTSGFAVSLPLATALVDMYGKCGDLCSARAVFDARRDKDPRIWSAMISAYAKARRNDEARDLFLQMRDGGTRPNEVTFLSLISLCAEIGALELGKSVHLFIAEQGLESDLRLGTAMVDMYAKCGDIDQAHSLFRNSAYRDTCTWNAMITGFAMHGRGHEALRLFEEMERLGVEPNKITFVALLKACSHAGLVAEGKRVFDGMARRHGLVPRIEHYGCLVDLLGRAGRLDEAHKVIETMPISPNAVVLGSLLASCKVHKNPALGEAIADRLRGLDPENCSYNILMSNIYASADRWNEVAGVRTAMKDSGTKKEPGLSSIEVDGSVHGFVMGDTSHPRAERIYEKLAEMSAKLRAAGHTPDTSVVFQNVEEEEKETALDHHSEKLAMAFGLISTPPGTPIRIVKNLRVCDDCHAATKLLSEIYGRVIIVRDRNRFHHFRDGSCSCGDYW